MTYTIVGPDVSFYQDDPETVRQIDFDAMAKVARFVIARAGQNVWVDPDFAYNWSHARAAGIPRGSYWYYDNRAEPMRQAELWANQFGSDLGELPLFADFEHSVAGNYSGWRNWRLFLDRLRQLVGNKTIGIYTAFYYWRDNAPKATLQPAELEYFHQYPLWIANYGAVAPLVPAPWKPDEWLFWQFTETGNGPLYGVESLGIDLNWFNGDAVRFNKLFGTTVELPPVPQPVESRIEIMPGVVLYTIFRFNSWCYVLEIKGGEHHVTKFGLKTVSQVAAETGAQIVVNGGGYNELGAIGLHVVEGWKYWPQLGWEPFINFDSTHKIATINAFDSKVQKHDALAGKRLLAENGLISPNRSPEWQDTHPRMIRGVKPGVVVFMAADGRQPGYSEGLTLVEAVAIMTAEFGCETVDEGDGGGSVTMVVNGKLINRPIDGNIPNKQRAVGTHIYSFIKGEPTMTLYEGESKSATAVDVRKAFPTGMKVGTVKPEQKIKADEERADSTGKVWLHITEIAGLVPAFLPGWAEARFFGYRLVGEPVPVPTPEPTPEPQPIPDTFTLKQHNEFIDDATGQVWEGDSITKLTKRP